MDGPIVAASMYENLGFKPHLTVTSPALVGTYAFVNPVVAVLLGWALANEPLSARTGTAAALVVVGVMLLVWPRNRK